MTRRRSVFLLAVALLVAHSLAYSQVRKIPGRTTYQPLTTAQAKDHIGEEATVCGYVVSARYAASSRGRPTFLNLDRPHPNQVFTVVIWGKNRAQFGKPEKDYLKKKICVTGKIETYRGKPQIEVKEFGQMVKIIGGGVSPPACISCPDPDYTRKARKAKLEGRVLLLCIVDESGRVQQILVVKSLGLGLDKEAIRAVQNWRFRPARRKGKPVPVYMNIEINFRLK